MRLLLLNIILMIMLPLVAVAAPNTEDTIKAEKFFKAMESSQPSYINIHNKYEQIKKREQDRYIYQTDVYDGPQGKGYIMRVIKVLNKKIWVIEKHVGPETDREIHTSWTKKEALYI